MTARERYDGMIAEYGTEAVMSGKLKGKTDTDYFRFSCPVCVDPPNILRIDDVGVYEQYKRTRGGEGGETKIAFRYAFELSCDKCGTHTVVKLTNIY